MGTVLGGKKHSGNISEIRASKCCLGQIPVIALLHLIRILDILSKQKKIPQPALSIIEVNYSEYLTNLCTFKSSVIILIAILVIVAFTQLHCNTPQVIFFPFIYSRADCLLTIAF